MAILLFSGGLTVLGAVSCHDGTSPGPPSSPEPTSASSPTWAPPPEDAWMFTHRFFSAIGQANHQAAVSAAQHAPPQEQEVAALAADAWMFTHRFFSAIGQANHQAAVSAAQHAPPQEQEVTVLAAEAAPSGEPVQVASDPPPEVRSASPPPSFAAAPSVQPPPPTPDLPAPEPMAEPTPEAPPEPTSDVQMGFDYVFAQGLLQLTNEARVANGLAPLNEHPALVTAAQKYAQIHTQVSPLELSHQVDGSTIKSRIEGEDYTNWTRIGENLHFNPLDVPRTVEQTFQNLMTGGHRDNILDPNFRDIGIACYVGMAEPYPVQICVQDFGARS